MCLCDIIHFVCVLMSCCIVTSLVVQRNHFISFLRFRFANFEDEGLVMIGKLLKVCAMSDLH